MKNTNTNAKIKRIVPAAVALCLLSSPVINSTAQSFLPSSAPSSIVMTLDADAASNKKMSGKSTAYVSNLINPSMTFCINSESLYNEMCNWLDDMVLATSGCKYSKNIVKYSNDILFGAWRPFYKGSKTLNTFEKIFKKCDNFGNKCKAAKKSLVSLHKKKPKKGLKVTIKLLGKFKVEYQ